MNELIEKWVAESYAKREEKIKELFESKFHMEWKDEYIDDVEKVLEVINVGSTFAYKGTLFAFIGVLKIDSNDKRVNTKFYFKQL